MDRLGSRLKAFAAAALQGALALLFVSAIVLVSLARCWGGISPNSGPGETGQLEMVEADLANPRHRAILTAISDTYLTTGRSSERLDVVIVDSPDLNAASFGEGRFLFWEAAGDLPEPELDALAAHEVAHDLLLHSRRARDTQDFIAFVAEVVSIFSGANPREEASLRSWLDAATLPRYSRTQELAADAEAVRILRDMGYENARGVFVQLLQTLLERYGDTGGGFTDSHPATSERIAELERNHATLERLP